MRAAARRRAEPRRNSAGGRPCTPAAPSPAEPPPSLGYPSATQTGEVGGLGQGANLRIVVPSVLLNAREARIELAQSLSFGEFRSGAFGFAFQRVTGRKVGMNKRQPGILAVRLFQPADRLVGMRLQ